MVILTVYTNQIKVKYKSTLLSKATFFVSLFVMLSIVLPFILAYKSGGDLWFWLKRDVFYEQPRINLRGEYLVLATTNNLSNPIVCSTFSYYQEKLDFLDVCSTFKLREIDDDFDGKVDKITLSIYINTFDNKVTSINLFLPINYTLNTVCPLQMQAAIIYQHDFQNSATNIRIVGDLTLFQSGPIQCRRKGVDDLYDYSVIEDESEEYELENIIERYWQRNISTQLSNIYTSVIPGHGSEFNLNLAVRYPEHKICYKPGFWQIMKWAWIQYFAIYIIIAWFISGVKRYIFNNRLVLFYKDTSAVKNK